MFNNLTFTGKIAASAGKPSSNRAFLPPLPLLSLLILCLVVLDMQRTALAGEMENHQNIRDAAERFALAHASGSGFIDLSVSAIRLDPRLRLERCSSELETFSNGVANPRRVTVGVRCNSGKPWTLYVPVTIQASTRIVSTARPVPRGTRLSAADLQMHTVDISRLPANTVSDPERVVGMEVTRALQSGVTLTVNMLREAKAIERGQEVIILARTRGLEVRMAGIAMDSGVPGELIPIRNRNSGRVIEGEIIDSGTVKVPL